MREEVITIDGETVMVGIMTEADQSSKACKKPVVLFSNAGFLHRVGPYRQWVDLARLLGESGFCVFRFDLPGLGDSGMLDDSLSPAAQSVSAIIKVMDHLEKSHGAKQFVIIGLCSGADIGFSVTVEDKRVIGMILIDSFGYRTPGWYAHYFLPRLLDVRGWPHRLVTLFRKIEHSSQAFRSSNPDYPDPRNKLYIRDFPPRKQTQVKLGQLIDRGVDMFFIYSNGAENYLNHARQFWSMFPRLHWKEKIQVQFYPEADHTFTLFEHRAKLEESIRSWMQRY